MAKPKQEAVSQVLSTMGEPDDPLKEKKPEPAYKQYKGAKVIVPKSFGKFVKKKMEAAIKAEELVRQAVDECYRYYNHNQVKDSVGPRRTPGTGFRRGQSTENIVYANVSTMVPAIYSKNPDVSFTTEDDDDKPFVETLSKAITALFKKKSPYGVNLKAKAKKAVLHAELANLGILKLDYTSKDDSREAAQEQMDELYEQMEKADDQNEVKKIEGRMMALEELMEWKEPAGFKLSHVNPGNFVSDPTAENEDGSDANWQMEAVFLATHYLNERFADEDKESGEFKLRYKPTHKIATGGDGERDDTLGVVLEAMKTNQTTQNSYSAEERMSYIYQHMTKCWWYHDKVTRRIYLFADNDWDWPIWVWEDELNTSRFFPYFLLAFSPSTGGMRSPSEVSYYLDQQDELNKINAEIVRIRAIVFAILVFNSNKIKADDAKKLISFLKTGVGDSAFGIDIPDGMTIKDMIETIAPPSINYEQLFNKQGTYQAIDKLGSVSDTLRGTQFKTNTTNKAIEQYSQSAAIRVNNRTDSIEDWTSDIAWTMAEILVSKGSKEQVVGLVGKKFGEAFRNMSIDEFNSNYSCEVAAGSSEKPTSERKKEQSLKVAQAIGNFSTAAPTATLQIVLKMLSKAFPDVELTDADLQAIVQEMQQTMMAQQAKPQAKQGQENAPEKKNGKGEGGIPPELENLPPEVKAQAVEAVKKGADPRAVIQQLTQKGH